MGRAWTMSAVIRLLSITFSDIVEVFYQCVNDARHSLREYRRLQLTALPTPKTHSNLPTSSHIEIVCHQVLRAQVSVYFLSYVCLRETIILIEDEKIQPSQGRTFTQ